MADDNHGEGRGYPPPRDPRALPREESQYPPPPGEEDDPRTIHPHPPMNRGPVTLPSIQDAYSTYAPPPSARLYPPPPSPSDPRAVLGYAQQSPPNANGYAAPPPPPPQYPLPAVHPSGDPRQPQQYADYYAQQPRPPPYDPYGYARFPQGPPQGPPPVGYNGYEYPRGNGPSQQAQAAPRQRTSIACRYCRKRKIRCSGYQNTNNGKCNNCDKLRIECIFQPVSSNASTAFVPVSALQGVVPPGTPLYGAYGQPLAPAVGPQQGPPPPHNAHYSTSPHEYPMVSPTATQYPTVPFDERSDPGRRRARPADEEHALRLPSSNSQQDDDPRRRSPASNHSSVTPPTGFHAFPPGPSPYEADSAQLPPRGGSGGSGGSGGPPGATAHPANPMSLTSLMGSDPRSQASQPSGPSSTQSDIDRGMLGKLNRRT